MFVIVNWKKYQGRKHVGLNPWVKLHKSVLLTDYIVLCDEKDRVRRMGILCFLLLICDDNTGEILLNSKQIAKKLRLKSFNPEPLTPWFLKSLHGNRSVTKEKQIGNTSVKSSASLSRSLSLSNKEIIVSVERWFEIEFWPIYPRKVAKGNTLGKLQKLDPSPELRKTIIADVLMKSKSKDWLKDGGEFIPYPITYINQTRWADEQTQLGIQALADNQEKDPFG